MARTRTGKAMVLLVLGFVLTSGSLLGGFAAPAQAAALQSETALPSDPASVQVMLGANRTSMAAARGMRHHLHAPAGAGGSTRPSSAVERSDATAVPDGVESGTTADDLTGVGRPSWWWGAWLLLAVPAGSVVAWWVSRPRGNPLPSTGPLYS